MLTDQIRTDILLAMAIRSGRRDALTGLDAEESQALEREWSRYDGLPPEEQARWLGQALGRGREENSGDTESLKEYVHPEQVAAALRSEPKRVQELVTGGARAPSPAIEAVVRRAFWSRFVTAGVLRRPTPLDLLTWRELARLLCLLGARETAVACRGIAEVETLTAYLRRHEAEDARLIVRYLTTLVAVDARRVAAAERLVRPAVTVPTGPGDRAGLDRVGLALVALALAGSEPARIRNTAQKLPLAAALELEVQTDRQRRDPDAEPARLTSQETEALAAQLRGALAAGGLANREDGAKDEQQAD